MQLNLTMNNGRKIPQLGLGVWKITEPGSCYSAVRTALEIGYRHIDTASAYKNEAEVGKAIRDSKIPRSEVFLTTKLWNSHQGYETALKACERSVTELGIGAVDLYLVHYPVPELRLESWRALIELKRRGLTKSIGVSNFMIPHLRELLATFEEKPVINQVEFHPFLYQKELMDYCHANTILLEAYSPLAHGQKVQDPKISAIAKNYGKTNAQVLIRWGIEHGLVMIPKSSNGKRIKENFEVFDFHLTPEHMAQMDSWNEDLRTCWDPSSEP